MPNMAQREGLLWTSIFMMQFREDIAEATLAEAFEKESLLAVQDTSLSTIQKDATIIDVMTDIAASK
ncbi:hypothetical protein chiPu_0012616 [Chiloscyllium punctatum]|uniref:Uncharacterized protein n=1 Tax=Chiloscyllium punctatum TaxID=137246 RepID=A0A401SUV5_CHIPU|nr:hypothetical protein [Chiloscyllium punctatum]